YICKPFSPREVVARAKAVFRRVHAEPQAQAHNLVVGSISLDDKTHQVTVDKQVLSLTPNEFGLLKIMMTRPNRVFSRSELINRVQGYDFEGYDRTIDTHIKNLRKKIAQKLPGQEIISTVYGIGYKFSAEPD
ncbi:MAG: response regulator transcription factor, partial [Desulfobacterales bacterium]|nr:response regulator transcription factor [Desulfobacterales bacterium]